MSWLDPSSKLFLAAAAASSFFLAASSSLALAASFSLFLAASSWSWSARSRRWFLPASEASGFFFLAAPQQWKLFWASGAEIRSSSLTTSSYRASGHDESFLTGDRRQSLRA